MLEKLDSDVCYEGKSSREGGPRVRGERGSCLWFPAPQSRKASGEKVTFEQRLEGGESESQDIWEEHRLKFYFHHPVSKVKSGMGWERTPECGCL